jgi:Tol biopolymer transport system component
MDAPAEVAASFQQFTSLNLGGDRAPAWSPDGTTVYYSTRLGGFPYIYSKASNAPMNASGTRLTSWEIEEFAVAASGDGSWVVIAAEDTLGFTRLWRCPATGGPPLTRMTAGPFEYLDPSWWGSGPSQEIAFATTRGGAGYQIWTLKPNGTQHATQFTAVTAPGSTDLHPNFSPDGSRIVFSSDRGGGRELFVCSREGNGWGAPVQLTSGGGDKAQPAYSPSGLSIAYQRLSTETELWIVDATGSNPRAVTDGSGDYDGEPSWSPTTSQMAFVSNRTGAGYIWLVNDVSTPAANSTWGRIKAQYRD